MDEQLKPQPSVAERIKLAKETLGVSRREIEDELTRLHNERNADGLKEVFNAYLTWELREAPKNSDKQNPDDITALALRNIDFVAEVADSRKVAVDDYSTLRTALDTDIVGPIQQFFRDTVGYHPKPTDNSNLN